MSKVHVYTLTYNEEVMLPQFIKHYRTNFPDCKITVMDNESIDKTVDIALYHNCEVLTWSSNDQIRDDLYLFIKNNCWKKTNADWVIVVDCDEFVDITQEDLQNTKDNMFKPQGYDMIGNSLNVDDIDCGIRSPGYDKLCVFKRKDFEEINYQPGCHNATPVTKNGVELSYNTNFKLFHYKWLTYDYVIERYKLFNKRLSDINKQYQWGIHYTFEEQKHKEYYDHANKHKVKVK